MQCTAVTLDCTEDSKHLNIFFMVMSVCLVVTYLTALSWHNFVMLTSSSQFRL